jgi:hypothetical protein
VVDVEKSNYPAGAIVLSGRRGAWQLETCGPAVVAWEARAGVRYVIMALDDQSDGGGNGGLLILNLRRLPPPPTIDVTVDPVGSFDPRSGAAVITGRVTCTGQSDYTELSITVTQRVGRLLIRGWGWSQVDCSGENLRWLIPVTADNGLFKGGHAATVTTGFTCGPFTCSEGYDETVVQLRR